MKVSLACDGPTRRLRWARIVDPGAPERTAKDGWTLAYPMGRSVPALEGAAVWESQPAATGAQAVRSLASRPA